MPERGEGGPLEGVDAIPWNTLQTAYGEAGTVPATLTKLASRDRDVADQGHAEIYDLGERRGMRGVVVAALGAVAVAVMLFLFRDRLGFGGDGPVAAVADDC